MKEPISLEPLFADRSSGEPVGAQLIRRLRSAIESEFFPPASRLLPSRELARRLGISRNTVTTALDQLVAEGYIEARVGSGTFVSETLRNVRKRTDASSHGQRIESAELADAEERLESVGSSFGPLRIGAPDLSRFPLRAWQRLERRSRAGFESHLDYGEANGRLALRKAIARHIAQFRGVVADPDQVVIVEGTQGALHLIAFALTRRGKRIVLEDPCYQFAAALFRAHGLTLQAIPVDSQGLQTKRLPGNGPLAYVTPSHQFPLGGAMPVARRMELLDWARRGNAYIIEDDYDSEFDSHPLPALQSLDRDERVVYVGTFSKTLAPGLGIGYVVAPPHLADTLRFTRSVMSRGIAVVLQQTIAAFIEHGFFSRHIRRMTAVYERRRNILVDLLTKRLPHGWSIGPAQTGLHVALTGPADFDDVAALGALPEGNRILSLSSLCIKRTDCKGFVVGFSDGSDEGVARTALLLADRLQGTSC